MLIGAELDPSPVYNNWLSLGAFETEGDLLKVRLTDMTGESYGSRWVGYDAIKISLGPESSPDSGLFLFFPSHVLL
ncbi:MAG: hypothetical protein D3925_00675 [Candidatus Electrothrix sp. AR5]|nr:hypothetical protein [Candidatus Electrothrix sp. AR5]